MPCESWQTSAKQLRIRLPLSGRLKRRPKLLQIQSVASLAFSAAKWKTSPGTNDRAMWPEYFDLLASQRFNRFNLAFGIGYDFIRKVTDAYFLFTYPFLLKVPGYNVRVPQVADSERDSNLAMLRYISEQCVMRGIEFHVGLWMHGYVWIDSPEANYTIEGLNKANHGPYCRDAVRTLLQEVPNIQGSYLPHPRRKRRGGRQLRVLENGL